MMKVFSVLLLSACLGWGDKVQILTSTSQDWIGGMRESGYGTDYKLMVKVKAGCGDLKIEDLWVGDIHMKVRMIIDTANAQNKASARGCMITVKAGAVYRPGPDDRVELLNADTLPKPFNFKGAGLLVYTMNGKRRHLEIAEFKKLDKLIYP
jgi:hypothetical protein